MEILIGLAIGGLIGFYVGSVSCASSMKAMFKQEMADSIERWRHAILKTTQDLVNERNELRRELYKKNEGE